MPINPMAKRPTIPPKPTHLPPPVTEDEQSERNPAREAVELYERLRQRLEEAKTSFEARHPHAVAELQSIREMEDEVREAIAAAKPLIAEAGESIGEFTCKRKFASAHYDSDEVTKILGSFENVGEVYADLYRVGVIKRIDFDKDRLVTYFSRDPGYAEAFKGAWREKTELTPAVSVPKL